jgi:hypothetical protein
MFLYLGEPPTKRSPREGHFIYQETESKKQFCNVNFLKLSQAKKVWGRGFASNKKFWLPLPQK